ncbi:hypothetical protein GCM10023340_25700 [Nocardioides marinquilinus]|uniref:Uncharacterized protein n=2 Tax=Nocardioides marinquilinus TaxID=1210400 RepID=A0ABP9PP82_9ACTN
MRRRLAALAVPICVLALSLSACGDDDEPTDASGTPTGETSTAPTTESTEATDATEPTAPSEPTESVSESESTEPTEATDETPEPTTAVPPSDPPTAPPSDPPAPPADPDAPATTYAEAEQRLDDLGQEPVDLDRFETPTGIYCLLSSDFLTGCELAGGGVPDPAVCGNDGPSQNVGRIEFGGGDPEPVCNSDTIREPGAKRLPLDSVARSSTSGITCLAQRVGVTCIDPGRTQGFFLGPDEYHVFSA